MEIVCRTQEGEARRLGGSPTHSNGFNMIRKASAAFAGIAKDILKARGVGHRCRIKIEKEAGNKRKRKKEEGIDKSQKRKTGTALPQQEVGVEAPGAHVDVIICTTCGTKREMTKPCLRCSIRFADPSWECLSILDYAELSSGETHLALNVELLCEAEKSKSAIILVVISTVSEDILHVWPENLQVNFDGHEVFSSTSSWPSQKEGRPLDLSQYCKKNSFESTPTVSLFLPEGPFSSFCAAVMSARKYDSIMLLKKVTEVVRNERAEPRTERDVGDEDVVCLSAPRLQDLTCPLGMRRMRVPAKGINCSHSRCFDLECYIDYNLCEKKIQKAWRCPLCGLLALPQDLIVDSSLQRALSRCEDGRESDASGCGAGASDGELEAGFHLTYFFALFIRRHARALQHILHCEVAG